MSVFGRATFSAAGYAAARPSYPPSLFKTVLAYHNAKSPNGQLLDIGCGPGLIARELSPSFKKVLAIDTSAGMIKQAQDSTDDAKISFRHGGVEDLSLLPDASVDLAVAGQAAHWFDYSRAWPELARVVKPGGSLAFWGYNDNFLVGHPHANKISDAFRYGTEEVAPGVEGMNSYWERPGRDIVRDLLRQVEPPSQSWEDVKRIMCDVTEDMAEIPDEETAWMRKRVNLGGFEAYLRTFSAFQGWADAHPEKKRRAEGGEGDLVDMLMERMIEAEPEWKAKGEGWRDVEVDAVWGTYILMAKRR